MANWKKVLVSGSTINVPSAQIDNLTTGEVVIGGGSGNLSTQAINGSGNILSTTGGTGVSMSGSFSGSFEGDGSGLTGVIADTLANSLTDSTGISDFTYDGSSPVSISVSGAAALSTNNITKWDGSAFADSSLTDNGTLLTGASSIQLSGANSSLTGSFTGSFDGDGSGLTGLVSTLNIDADSGGPSTVDLLSQTLDIEGTANEIETSVSGQVITVGLPNDVTISNDLNVTGDLTVNGTASFQNTENLLVADRFVLFASGSVSTGDGGIIVQQGTQDIGELYGYDSGTTRWGFTSSFNADDSSFTPAAYAGVVQVGTGQTAASAAPIYGGSGNGHGTMHIDTDDGEIWIYS